jgi:hypothetical protein
MCYAFLPLLLAKDKPGMLNFRETNETGGKDEDLHKRERTALYPGTTSPSFLNVALLLKHPKTGPPFFPGM